MDALSPQANSLWAKKGGSTDGGQLNWLPLFTHMKDAAGTAKLLWNNWLPRSTQNAIQCGIRGEGSAEKLFIFLAASHDIGKATPVFQVKPSWSGYRQRSSVDLDERILDNLEATGLPVLPYSCLLSPSASPHALASQLLLERVGCDRSIAIILGAHHGIPPSIYTLRRKGVSSFPDNFHLGESGKSAWTTVQNELIEWALELSGFSHVNELPQPNMVAQMLLSGLVIMVDWIASDESRFPYVSFDEENSVSEKNARHFDAWGTLSLSNRWEPEEMKDCVQHFRNRFNFYPNPLQMTVSEIAGDVEKPGIFIVEAPMGIGKTEAALTATEVFARKTKCSGLFFALPTQATTNGMFLRLRPWFDRVSPNTHTVKLVHSKAQFNDEYRGMKFFDGGSNIEDEEGGTVVHSWFEGQKKSLLADFVVGTIDQLLLSSLRQKHVMLRHLGLSGKVVVIDECHAFDAYMNEYLERALQWLGAYHVPVIMLSATLPAQARQNLVDAYHGKRAATNERTNIFDDTEDTPNEASQSLENMAYPLITYSDGENVNHREVKLAEPPSEVVFKSLKFNAMMSQLDELLEEGGCVGIILNTVRRSQEVAGMLRKIFGDEAVRLIHSRFLATERARKEAELINELGAPRGSTQRPHMRIYVGTQIFEQSLDIDFDVLITDLCPMDLLLQRVGRMHRHQRPRPTKLSRACCYILHSEGGKFDRGSTFVYGDYLLMRTAALLPEKIFLPQDIGYLVQRTYDGHEIKDLTSERYERAELSWEARVTDKRKRAKAFRLGRPWPGHGETIAGILDTDVRLTEQHVEAAVRDTNDAFEVILIQKQLHGQYNLLFSPDIKDGCAPEILFNEELGDSIAKKIAMQTIRLPVGLCLPHAIDRTIEELEESTIRDLSEWQKSSWLAGELFLILDENLEAELNGYHIEYRFDEGLVYEREEGRL